MFIFVFMYVYVYIYICVCVCAHVCFGKQHHIFSHFAGFYPPSLSLSPLHPFIYVGCRDLSHPHLVQLLGVCTRDGPLWIVVELMSKGGHDCISK